MSVSEDVNSWFVLRDLKRWNAKEPAYSLLQKQGFRIFTPMITQVVERQGRRLKEQVPVIRDLLFACASRSDLDPVIDRVDTLQYRYVKGAPYRQPMTVPNIEMERFIAAIGMRPDPTYLRPDQISPSMLGKRVRVIGSGPLHGYEGRLLKVRGSGKKRLIIEVQGIIAAAIEVAAADYIEILPPY